VAFINRLDGESVETSQAENVVAEARANFIEGCYAPVASGNQFFEAPAEPPNKRCALGLDASPISNRCVYRFVIALPPEGSCDAKCGHKARIARALRSTRQRFSVGGMESGWSSDKAAP
jgi:hypothetical protein